jgi:hypothetical protein
MRLSELPGVFASLVPEALIHALGHGEDGRLRLYTPLVTFWAFLSQAVNPEASCRETVRRIQAAQVATTGHSDASSDSSAYCQARRRLPEALLSEVHEHVSHRLQQTPSPVSALWCGRKVRVIDGSCLSMPDTSENQAQYPQPSEQKTGLGFPVLRLVASFDLASGAAEDWREGSLHDSERALFVALLPTFHPGGVVLGDRLLCSFANIAVLHQQHVDTVFRVLGRRRQDFRRGTRIGKNERLVTWRKPYQRPAWITPEQWEVLPPTLTLRLVRVVVAVRGFRTQRIILVTTLLDQQAYTADDLAELYFRRWRCELFLRDLKITLRMDVLRCQSPSMVRKEIWMHLIAYNLIRWLMLQAAARHPPLLPSRISFKGTVDALRQWLPLLRAAAWHPPTFHPIFERFLAILAEDLVPLRPHRSEPRARKRRPKNYHLLTKPRHQMGNLPHRNYPSKGDRKHA